MILSLQSVGQATAYMQLGTWELGVDSCLTSIYEPDKSREILGFPAEWQVQICISFGYPLKIQVITAALKKGGRKPIEALLHWDRW
jgi:nitroreductase